MYDATTILHRISDHVALVLALGGIALVCNYVFFWEAARHSSRNRCVPFLPLAVGLWFAHDATYLIDAHRWFSTYHHWFPELFWFGLMATFGFELVYLSQTWRFGRAELTPRLSERGFRLFFIGAVAIAVVFWAITKSTLDDPLFLMTFMLTAVWALASNAVLAVRRGTREGQSVLQWVAFTGMIASYAAVSIAVFGGQFRHPAWIVLCLVGILGGVGMTWWASITAEPEAAAPDSIRAAAPATVAS
jgi:hypothetical protein